ncbi:radical SAM superfamily enzyme YgiQ (UPF0313 family) [Trinickia symbiotica]|uniref:Radical SAM protein n=1 Tax=Trinickia symbiotica TaxID=863227 RepID=A0A2N7X4G9_9BURK|nr:hypothetical protein [Trinickia symbiotica]PMS36500.1 radical SAM protein [Trinickia symbiotica]PPK44370.1 radical SAM superfamily enzyme YgiQ (UPF0313 family) [Trinickia symbiotica]
MRNLRTVVFFVNPPNSDDLDSGQNGETAVSKGVQHTDWANFPHLGILSLASYIDSLPGMEAVYVDGVVHPLSAILGLIRERMHQTLAVCLSAITANYEAAIILAKEIKDLDPSVAVIMGNDHFSSLSNSILVRHKDLIDCGFAGNEVYSGLADYLRDRQRHRTDGVYPGCVRWQHEEIVRDPQIREGINQIVDYSLIDRGLQHTATYTSNFARRLGDRIHKLTGRHVKKGVPVEIGRGCIKFNGDDACSFCSIQYGGMWKNELPGAHAWEAIRKAWLCGYDYLYITADELPLTFARLILDMARTPPAWWQSLAFEQRPVLVGYARADGMEKGHVLEAMREIGFRILFVGVDAGAPLSLLALNKPLRHKDAAVAATKMYESNLRALRNARKCGLAIKAGFVLGHLGMNETLMEANVQMYIDFLRSGRDVIVSADIELLSPEPGSKDFLYLTEPDAAAELSKRLGLEIAEDRLRRQVADRYRGVDLFDREMAIGDYVRAVMPRLSKDQIATARDRVREECRQLGIVIGDSI